MISQLLKTTLILLLIQVLFLQQSTAQQEVMSLEEKVTAIVEEKESAVSFSGSVDAYFRSNSEAPATSFANLNGFALGMVNLVAAHEGEKAGFVGDLVFGPRGADAVFTSVGSANIVNQLYAYWNVTDNVTLTLGNFNTFLGYEVISPTANFNYSTSYMFSYGPFSHTGIKADFSFDGGFSLMLGGFNATDYTEFQPTAGTHPDFPDSDANYFGGIQLGYEFDSGGAWLNGLFTDGFWQIDLTAGFDVTDNVYVGINATTADDTFSGIAGYLQLATSDALSFGVRAEYFSDTAGVALAPDENVFDITLSANYSTGNLTIIPEVRLDSASADLFDGGSSGSLSSFVLAAVYGF